MLHIENIRIIDLFIGVLGFICLNISYAILAIHSCPKLVQIASWIITVLLILLFLWVRIKPSRATSVFPLIIQNILPSIIIVTLSGWLLLISCVYLFQYQVLYTNSHINNTYYNQLQIHADHYENINLITSDHVNLQGYLYKGKINERTPLAIYFGGRGEEAANIVEYASKIKGGWSLAFINYRGCGSSTGRQSSELLFSDAALIYDYFAKRNDIDPNNIVLISHSLGTGVAIHLASQRDIKGVILSCPYDKYVTGVIQDKLPLVPLQLLINEEYNSISIVPKLKIPALFLLAENDKTVLRSRSIRLFNHWGGKPEKVIIKGTNHENITFNTLTWEYINKFLTQLN